MTARCARRCLPVDLRGPFPRARISKQAGAPSIILVIDDDEAVSKVLSRLLKREGFETLLARNGSDAVHLYAERSQDIAAATLDMIMPTTNGRETLAMLSEFAPNLPIVVVTATELPTNLIGRKPGTRGIGYVRKPFTSEGLIAELRRVIEEMRTEE